MINFCFDHMSSPGVLGYPNLARPDLQPDEFDHTWPRTVPLRLLVYLDQAGLKHRSFDITDAPRGSWYPVALSWHDFDCDYFALMSDRVRTLVRQKHIKILFYYHEGDNPFHIKQRLDRLVSHHDLPSDCYIFISANTAAENLENFFYFPDHEYFFRYVNKWQSMPGEISLERPYTFTALNRTHKWWRAAVMADLHQKKLLENSHWSYNTECTINDDEKDNPLELDYYPGWRESMHEFVRKGPYWCDSNDQHSHNDHRAVETFLYTSSICHLVIETFLDADGSGGTFLTEKTYKCIKFGQPFVIIGTPNSLRALRDQGYRVFDHAIDNSYDTIINPTQRWKSLCQTIEKIKVQDPNSWFLSCLDDVRHNQRLFSQQFSDLNNLYHVISQ